MPCSLRLRCKEEKKRQRDGIEAKKARGEWEDHGRKRVMSADDFAKHYQRVERDEIGLRAFMCELKMKKSTYFRYVKEYKKINQID